MRGVIQLREPAGFYFRGDEKDIHRDSGDWTVERPEYKSRGAEFVPFAALRVTIPAQNVAFVTWGADEVEAKLAKIA